MARYEHLPIYQKAMETGVYLDIVVRQFSRYHKYTTGQDLRNLSRTIIQLIIRANSAIDKVQILTELVETCEVLKSMVAFSKEIKAFNSFSSFQHAATLVVMLCRQSEGWLKSSKKSQNHQPPYKPAGR